MKRYNILIFCFQCRIMILFLYSANRYGANFMAKFRWESDFLRLGPLLDTNRSESTLVILSVNNIILFIILTDSVEISAFNWILLIIDIILILGIIGLILGWFFICRRRKVKAIEFTPITNPSEEVFPINTNVEYRIPLDTSASQIVPTQIIPNYFLLQVLRIIVCLFVCVCVCVCLFICTTGLSMRKNTESP